MRRVLHLQGHMYANHFLLPVNTNEQDFISESARYGVYAMEILINHMLKLGAVRSRIEAKIFGGANFFLLECQVMSKGTGLSWFHSEYLNGSISSPLIFVIGITNLPCCIANSEALILLGLKLVII